MCIEVVRLVSLGVPKDTLVVLFEKKKEFLNFNFLLFWTLVTPVESWCLSLERTGSYLCHPSSQFSTFKLSASVTNSRAEFGVECGLNLDLTNSGQLNLKGNEIRFYLN